MNVLKSRYWLVITTLAISVTFLTTLIIYRQPEDNTIKKKINFQFSEYDFSDDSLEIWKLINSEKTDISILDYDYDSASDRLIIQQKLANFKNVQDLNFYEEFAVDQLDESLVLK